MVRDPADEIAVIHDAGGLAVCADLLALASLVPPGEMGADIVVGSGVWRVVASVIRMLHILLAVRPATLNSDDC